MKHPHVIYVFHSAFDDLGRASFTKLWPDPDAPALDERRGPIRGQCFFCDPKPHQARDRERGHHFEELSTWRSGDPNDETAIERGRALLQPILEAMQSKPKPVTDRQRAALELIEQRPLDPSIMPGWLRGGQTLRALVTRQLIKHEPDGCYHLTARGQLALGATS